MNCLFCDGIEKNYKPAIGFISEAPVFHTTLEWEYKERKMGA